MRSICLSWVWAPGLFCALLAASCGEAFSSTEGAGGASHQGGAGAGDGSLAGAGSPAETGGTSNGGVGPSSDGGARASGSGDAGTTAIGGEAGADNATGVCAAFHGLEYEGHCYVDVTADSTSQTAAVAACEQLAAGGKVAGHLLVLDSPEEQNFVLRSFMVPFTDKSDAWLALTCSELSQPDITACYCAGCTKAMLAEKQQAWASLTGAPSTFGWVNGNPNEPYRCAALAYNPDTMIWGWVDRPCDKSSFQPSNGHLHEYRTLCELEP